MSVYNFTYDICTCTELENISRIHGVYDNACFFVSSSCMQPKINLRRFNCLKTDLGCYFELTVLRCRYYGPTILTVDINYFDLKKKIYIAFVRLQIWIQLADGQQMHFIRA